MGFINPAVSDFKAYFLRDFMYTVDQTGVMDQDILNAQADATAFLNVDNFGDQPTYFLAFNLLTAHFLGMNILASSGGLGSPFAWPASSKSVGSVSISSAISARITENPEFAYLTSTQYGTKYLMLVLPLLVGSCGSVYGGTNS